MSPVFLVSYGQALQSGVVHVGDPSMVEKVLVFTRDLQGFTIYAIKSVGFCSHFHLTAKSGGDGVLYLEWFTPC